MLPFPNKKYQIIYADPPWQYENTQEELEGGGFGACARYQVMAFEDIYKLPIKAIADKDCVLFLWATSPLLPEALLTITAWGFEYKTIGFVWSKQSGFGKWIANMGNYTMSNVELCLIGRKGQPKRVCKTVKQLVISVRKGHSHKPDEIRDRIYQLYGDLPRIELFARQRTTGWDVWGDEDGTVTEGHITKQEVLFKVKK